MRAARHRWLRPFASSTLLCAVFACSLDFSVGSFTGADGGPDGSLEPEGGKASLVYVEDGVLPRTQTVTGTVHLRSPPTKAGNLLVVVVARETNESGVVRSITDDAPKGSATYVPVKMRSVDSTCQNSLEIWYAKDIRDGATSVTVSMSAEAAIEAWAIEFAGASKVEPFDNAGVLNQQPPGTVRAPSLTPSVPSALVISAAMSCEDFGDLQSDSGFVSLDTLNGEKVAYFIANQMGSYGAVWKAGTDAGTWNASTVVFR